MRFYCILIAKDSIDSLTDGEAGDQMPHTFSEGGSAPESPEQTGRQQLQGMDCGNRIQFSSRGGSLEGSSDAGQGSRRRLSGGSKRTEHQLDSTSLSSEGKVKPPFQDHNGKCLRVPGHLLPSGQRLLR